MHPEYNYIGYGLKIRSDLYFPEFYSSVNQLEDIRIRLSNQSDFQEAPIECNKSFSKETEHGTLFQVANVAIYLVKNGTEIEVSPFEGSDPGAVRLFLLSNAMAILLIQRGQILLHASAIRIENGLVVFLGESGAGKSSMLAELVRRGYQPFSDDVIVLEHDAASSEIVAFPSYPMIKLWKETIDMLGSDTSVEGHRLRQGVDKFGYFFHDRYQLEPVRIQKLLVIEKDPTCASYRIQELGGLSSFEILSRNIYRRQYIKQDNLRKKHLLLISQLLNQAGIKMLMRPSNHGSISAFADFAEEALNAEYKQK
jgi:hypothetical protein